MGMMRFFAQALDRTREATGLQLRDDRFHSGTRLYSPADVANDFPSDFLPLQVRPFALLGSFARLRSKEC